MSVAVFLPVPLLLLPNQLQPKQDVVSLFRKERGAGSLFILNDGNEIKHWMSLNDPKCSRSELECCVRSQVCAIPKPTELWCPAQLQHHRWMNAQKMLELRGHEPEKLPNKSAENSGSCSEQKSCGHSVEMPELWWAQSHGVTPDWLRMCHFLQEESQRSGKCSGGKNNSKCWVTWRASALCAGFGGFEQQNIKHQRAPKDRSGEAQRERKQVGSWQGKKGSSFSNHIPVSELCYDF